VICTEAGSLDLVDRHPLLPCVGFLLYKKWNQLGFRARTSRRKGWTLCEQWATLT
jgi:hypothetical protein